MTVTALMPGAGKVVKIFDHSVTIKLRGEETGGVFSLVENDTPPGVAIALHVHHQEDETFYVIEGQFEFYIGSDLILAEPGSCLFAPRGIPHGYKNVGTKNGRMVAVISPPGLEAFFDWLHTSAQRRSLPVSRVAGVATEYGLIFLP